MAFGLMDVFVKIGADTSGLEDGVNKSKGIVGGLTEKLGGIGGAITGGLKVVGAAIGTATTAVGAFGGMAVKSYAEYEQLVGGVEKLYGEAAGKLQSFADEAYKTSGMSANQYMETATSFSAALINSLDGDVDKAADITDVAMRAMSDNVNVFGSDMESVQNAFQGFAKQNYTMLDNLKLGYGGTKEGMEQLIADANEYRASIGETADLSIDSFADVVQAIQSVQEAQNIAGTTNKEAMSTIEGSAAATKAAWENVITAIGRGEGLSEAMNSLANSLFGENEGEGLLNQIIPRIETVMQGIGDFVAKAGPIIGNKIPALISSVVPKVLESGMNLLNALGQGVLDNLPMLIDVTVQIVNQLISGIAEALPAITEGGIQIIAGLANGITQTLPTLIPTIVEVVTQIVQTLIENVPLLINAAFQLVQGLAEGILNSIPVLIEMAPMLIESLVKAITEGVPSFVQGAINLVQGIVTALPRIIQSLILALPTVIDALVNGLMSTLPLMIQANIQLVLGLVKAMPQIIKALVAAIPTIIKTITDALINNLPLIIQGLVDLTAQIVVALPEIIMAIIQVIPTLIASIVQAILASAPLIFNAVVQILSTIGTTLVQKGAEFLSNVGQTMSDIYNKVIEWLSQLPERMAYWAGYAVVSFMKFIKELPGKIKTEFDDVMSKLSEFATDFIQKAKDTSREFLESLLEKIEEAPDKLRELGNDMIDALKELPEKFKQMGKDMIQGLINGLVELKEKVVETVKGIITAGYQGGKDAAESKSPSKKFKRLGRWLDQGLIIGMEDELPEVRKTAQELVDAIQIPDQSVNFSYTGSADEINSSLRTPTNEGGEILGVTDMVDAFVKALDRYGLTVEVDNRELGRVVRREVMA